MDIEKGLLADEKHEHLPAYVTIVNPVLVSRTSYHESSDTQWIWFRGQGKSALQLKRIKQGYASRFVLSGSETPTTHVITCETKRGYVVSMRVADIESITWVRGSLTSHVTTGYFTNSTEKEYVNPLVAEREDFDCFTSVEESVRVFREVEAAFGLPPSPYVTPDPLPVMATPAEIAATKKHDWCVLFACAVVIIYCCMCMISGEECPGLHHSWKRGR